MAALTDDFVYSLLGDSSFPIQIIDAAVIRAGSIVEAATNDNATAANQGRIRVFAGAAQSLTIGRSIEGETGDTSASPIGRGRTSLLPEIIRNVTVTGVTDQTDHFRPVYLTTDNLADLTLTRPTLGSPVGCIMRHITGTTCDVLWFGFIANYTIGLAGAGQYLWNLGTIAPVLTASGDMLTGITAPHAGRILDIYAICIRTPTDADVDIDVNLEIGGTNVTGGVVALLAADAVAAKKSGTAITALNIVSEGDLIDVEGVVNTAGTATDVGAYNLYATVEMLPGF